MMATRRVLCVGNELCHDDGVASVVGRLLERHGSDLDDVEVIHAAEFGLSSLDAFLGAEHVVIVDALVTGQTPGTCRIIDGNDFAPAASCSIGHAITVSSMIELVARLSPEGKAPKVTLVGIEAENLLPFGTTLSASVEAAVPAALALVQTALRGSVSVPDLSEGPVDTGLRSFQS